MTETPLNRCECCSDIEICELKKIKKNISINNSCEVMKRWNVKILADPNVNLSRCYYRCRRFKEEKNIKPMVFKKLTRHKHCIKSEISTRTLSMR